MIRKLVVLISAMPLHVWVSTRDICNSVSVELLVFALQHSDCRYFASDTRWRAILFFEYLGFNDTESVALIGGGHAFGKAHGACPPEEAPCGEGELQGKGPNTLTSGLEGKWTLTPTVWTNDFFINMFDLEWEQTTSPAGALQWKPAGNVTDDIFMLTSDLALAADPDYRVISEGFKNDITSLETQFAAAWYRLTTADMGPATRCVGNFVPPPQGFQYTLPSAPDNDIDYKLVYDKIAAMIEMDKATHIAAFTNLAFQCASTFRSTDFQGKGRIIISGTLIF